MRSCAIRLRARSFAVCALLALPTMASFAQGKQILADVAAARSLTTAVMAKVAAGEMEAGLRLMQPYIVISDAEFETALGQAQKQVPIMTQRFGKTIGAEFLREEQVGQRLLRITQAQLFEQHATRWTFYFYRTPKGWILNTFQYDDNIKSFF